MKRTYQILAVTCLALLVIAACRKPNNKRTTDIDPTTVNTGGQPPIFPGTKDPTLSKLMKKLAYTPEVICITAGIPQTVTFSKGTILSFYPNSFKYASGEIVTSGNVCIEMIEMYTPGAMIANNATTQTMTGELLQSGGQVHIKATKDGEEVFANTYDIRYKQPAQSSQTMYLYYGNTKNADSVVQWEIADTMQAGTVAVGTIIDSTIPPTPPLPPPPFNPNYLFQDCNHFGFTNCDCIRDTSIPRFLTTVVINDPSFTRSNTKVFFVLHEINGVARADSYFGNTQLSATLGSSNGDPHCAPEGMSLSIVVIAAKNDKYYYFEKHGLTTGEGLTVTATLTEKSEDYIRTTLATL
jgi:hypothetical protein